MWLNQMHETIVMYTIMFFLFFLFFSVAIGTVFDVPLPFMSLFFWFFLISLHYSRYPSWCPVSLLFSFPCFLEIYWNKEDIYLVSGGVSNILSVLWGLFLMLFSIVILLSFRFSSRQPLTSHFLFYHFVIRDFPKCFCNMALSFSAEVASFIGYRRFPTPPVLPAFVTNTIVRVPADQDPWFRFEARERSDDLILAARIVLQSNVTRLQM